MNERSQNRQRGAGGDPQLGRQFGLNDFDSVGERVRRAAAMPGVVVVEYGSKGAGQGPYRVHQNP